MLQLSPFSIDAVDNVKVDSSREIQSSLHLLGPSVFYLKNVLLEEVNEFGDRNSTIFELDNLNEADKPGLLRKKGRSMTCPMDGSRGRSYVHCLQGKDNVGIARHMLSLRWTYKIGDIVDTLDDFCQSTGLDPKETYVWIDPFCLNYNRLDKLRQLPREQYKKKFTERALGIGHLLAMMFPWNEPAYFTRAYCIFELHTALNVGCEVTIVMPPREKEAFRNYLRVHCDNENKVLEGIGIPDLEDIRNTLREHDDHENKALEGICVPDLEDILPQIQFDQAQAADAAHQELLLSWVENDPASDPLFVANKQRVKDLLLDWAVRSVPTLATATTPVDDLEEIKRDSGGKAATSFSSFDRRAVSIHHLQTTFLDEVCSTPGLSRDSKIHEIENLDGETLGVIRRVGIDKICPHDGKKGAAYVNCLSGDDNVGTATYMLSYSWSYKIGEIVDTLADFCNAHGINPKRTYVWMCCLCINQHRVAEQKRTERSGAVAPPDVDFFAEFGDRVEGVGHVLAMMAPWNDPVYLQRIWCIYELYTAQTKGCQITIVMPPREKEVLGRDLFGDGGKGIDALYSVLSKTRIQNAQATVENDRRAILKMIAETPGYVALNMIVNEKLRVWVRQVVAEVIRRRQEEEARFCSEISSLLNRNGEHDGALEMGEKAISILGDLKAWGVATETQQSNGENRHFGRKQHELLAISHNNLGSVRRSKGDYQGAESEHRAALAIANEALGHAHIETARCHSELGAAFSARGLYDSALKEYQTSLSILEETVEHDHPEVARCYCNVGATLSSKGDNDGALAQHRQALAIFESTLGPECVETAHSSACIGSAFLSLGDYVNALIVTRRALATLEMLLGKRHPDTATCYCNVGCIYFCRGDYPEALTEFRRALAIFESALGGDHPHTTVVRVNIERVLEKI